MAFHFRSREKDLRGEKPFNLRGGVGKRDWFRRKKDQQKNLHFNHEKSLRFLGVRGAPAEKLAARKGRSNRKERFLRYDSAERWQFGKNKKAQ